MATITNHYNVPVSSRFYDFLQDDRESADPQALIASAAKKLELKKQKKSKDKIAKRLKQVADFKKEIKDEAVAKDLAKVDDQVKVNEPLVKVDEQVMEIKPIVVDKEKTIEAVDSLREEDTIEHRDENRTERGQRGRGQYKRGGRGGSFKNDVNALNDNVVHKSHGDNYQPSSGSNTGRQYRREKNDERDDSFNKVGYFEEQPQSGYRGGVDRRRPFNRGGSYHRGNDRRANEEFTSEIVNNDTGDNIERIDDSADKAPIRAPRGRYPRNNRGGFNRFKRPATDGNDRIVNEEFSSEIVNNDTGNNIERTEDSIDRAPVRAPRGRYPRNNRGGFNRFQRPDADDGSEFRSNRMGYFDENADNREFQSRGYNRGGRGNRRGRGDFRKPREQDNADNHEENQERPTSPEKSTWETMEDNFECSHQDTVVPDQHKDTPINEEKNTDWGEIEDDPMEVKEDPKVTMTLEEWKAHNASDRVIQYTTSGKEIRKANDGQDVFSGMSEYRKGKSAEEQSEEPEVHETTHGRQKQPIPMAVRFSRNVDYNETNNFEATKTDSGRTYSRTFTPRGRDNQSGNRGGDGASRGRQRDGSDYNAKGQSYDRVSSDQNPDDRSGSDFNRFDRGRSYYNNRGRGGSDYNMEGRMGADNQEFISRGKEGPEFTRRGRGGSDFVRRDRGGSDFTRRGRGGSDANTDGRNESDLNVDEKSGYEANVSNRGGSEFSRRGRGGSDFVRRDRGGSDFTRRGRGGSDANVDGVQESDLNVNEKSGLEFSRRGQGGSDFSRRGRGGSDAHNEGRNELDLKTEDPSNADVNFVSKGGSDFNRRDRGGSDFNRRDRGGSDFNRRDRGGSDFNRRGRGGYDLNFYADDNTRGQGDLDFNRRGRGGSEYNSRGRGSSNYSSRGGMSSDVARGGKEESEMSRQDDRQESDLVASDKGSSPEAHVRGRGGRGRSNVNRYDRGGSDYRSDGRDGSDFGRSDRGGRGSDFNSDDRGRDPPRGNRGRAGPRTAQYQDNSIAEEIVVVNINLGNEDEFPHLS